MFLQIFSELNVKPSISYQIIQQLTFWDSLSVPKASYAGPPVNEALYIMSHHHPQDSLSVSKASCRHYRQ